MSQELRPLNFPVVGLGASAGGLKALLSFFEQTPDDPGMAFVVILHLSPTHESNLAHLLQAVTSLKVEQVNESVRIEPDHVYVIPPNRDLSMDDGHLRLSEVSRPKGRHVSIDLFFRTLADEHKDRAMCVVLSGTGSDGTAGLTRVKEHGGITVAQDPADAEYDSMPRSAINTGMVDIVLPAAEIPKKLIQLWKDAGEIRLPPVEDPSAPVKMTSESAPEAEQALRNILTILHQRSGHDFTHYKRATVIRRIERRLQLNQLRDLPQYYEYLRANKEETPALLKDMLISVTNFFRDEEAFESLEHRIIPELAAEKTAGQQFRVWVPACATGEESYSLAILLNECCSTLDLALDIQVFATDIDERAVAVARQGYYPDSIEGDVSPARLRNFFTREPSGYRIKKTIREKILFSAHNLIKDPPFSRMDIVSCRNLLIYLNRDMQEKVLQLLHFSLRPGGILFLGSSESADATPHLFTPIDKKHHLYRAHIVEPARMQIPTVPLAVSSDPLVATGENSHQRKIASFAGLHQKMLEQYAPPSVLIDQDYEIVHLSDRAGRFLQFAGGEPSHNLLKVVHPALRLELRTALFQAIQTEKSVEARRTRLEREGHESYINMIVRPVRDPENGARFLFVIFDEVEDTMSPEAKVPQDFEKEPFVRRLEEELHHTKEDLQATIEQYETSTEELKASNEELQAINEELRATSEELETSKEELQSINEELHTVNQELKNNVDESARVNDDLRNLISSTDIATIFIDRNIRIKWYTPTVLKLFNMITSDVGRSLYDITNRLDYRLLSDDINGVLVSLHPVEREIRSEDGSWYIARFFPYRTTEDRIDGVILTFIDISRRKLAEENVRSSEERLRLIVESARDYAIFTLDVDGRINIWNRGAERIFGFSESEAVGETYDILFPPEDRKANVHVQEMKKAREEGRAEDERWLLRQDGALIYCSGVMTPLFNGDLRGYAKILRDLTEQQKANSAREELLLREKKVRVAAESANRMKDEFLAILSHELKHPLNLIQMNAEVLMRLPGCQLLPDVLRVSQAIQQTVHSQVKIIDDLLDLSRQKTGNFTLHRHVVPLLSIVEEAINTVRSTAESKRIALTADLTSQLLMVDVDAVRIEQIVWNLLSNAIKFTLPGGRVTVRLEHDMNEAKLVVEDTGLGIDPGLLPHIFEMFWQAGSVTTRKQGGLGIGLALVQQLVELHGGRTLAESEGEGRGSRFTIWLPLVAGVRQSEPRLVRSAVTEALKGVRILVVDDDSDTTNIMRVLLQYEGARIDTATSGEEALELTQSEEFDIIISDIGMPDMDGYTLIQELRKSDSSSKTPVIAITGFTRKQDLDRTLDAGFAGCLTKPLVFDELIRKVRLLTFDAV